MGKIQLAFFNINLDQKTIETKNWVFQKICVFFILRNVGSKIITGPCYLLVFNFVLKKKNKFSEKINK